MKMTKEQAIKTLESLLFNIAGEKDCQAIELAIAALQSDPNAPDWSQAPEWANYYAIEADGQSFWFENEPQKVNLSYEEYFGSWSKSKDPKNMKLYKRPDK